MDSYTHIYYEYIRLFMFGAIDFEKIESPYYVHRDIFYLENWSGLYMHCSIIYILL